MFIHYYKYKTKYISEEIAVDERLKIVYPTDEHSMITVGHDFYVIGSFRGIEVSSEAKLKVELRKLDTGEVIRTVAAGKKDHRDGIYVDYSGIETEDDRETVRSCGMPDLVYDPEDPESFWYTWNKAYFTDRVFSALVYGGTCKLERTCPYDQFGKELQPIEEGYYELRVSLDNDGEIISSAKTLWFTEGKKEIVLSRFSPDNHLARVHQFVEEEGFEPFTDPYAGIWDTQHFAVEWPVKAWVEIPARWHFGDAQEYESGRVHFFNYNISEACVSWKTEIGTMIAKERECVDNQGRLLTYFYENGDPDSEQKEAAAGKLGVMKPYTYFQITGKEIRAEDEKWVLKIEAICKPLPTETRQISGCAYEMQNRVAYFDYQLFGAETGKLIWTSEGNETGVISQKTDGPDEFLILHVSHRLTMEAKDLSGDMRLVITAKDLQGNRIEQQTHMLQ